MAGSRHLTEDDWRQMIAPKDFLHRLRRDEVLLGTWSIIANATIVEIMCMAGLDFVILDLEHGVYDFGTLENAIRSAQGAGAAALVRVPDLTPATFQRVLDLGAQGVVVPQVRSAEDAADAVRCARWYPDGGRGYNPFTRASKYAAPPTVSGSDLISGLPAVAVIIENIEAYEDLGEICATPGLDVIYLGIYDMSLALGCDGDTQHPKVRAFVETAAAQVRSAGKTLGMMVRDDVSAEFALKLGASMLVWSVDSHMIWRAFRGPVEAISRRTEQIQPTKGDV